MTVVLRGLRLEIRRCGYRPRCVGILASLVEGGGLNRETVQLRWMHASTRRKNHWVRALIGVWNYPIQLYAAHKPYLLGLEVKFNSAISLAPFFCYFPFLHPLFHISKISLLSVLAK